MEPSGLNSSAGTLNDISIFTLKNLRKEFVKLVISIQCFILTEMGMNVATKHNSWAEGSGLNFINLNICNRNISHKEMEMETLAGLKHS